MHEGLWRPSEPTEEQQPIPGPLRIQAAQRGPAFQRREQYPYIDSDTNAAISSWFQQNLDDLVGEWIPASDNSLNEVTAQWLEENTPKNLQEWDQPVSTTRVSDAPELLRPGHPEPRGALPFADLPEPESGENPLFWPDNPDDSNSSTNPNPFIDPVHQQRDSDPFNTRGGDYKWANPYQPRSRDLQTPPNRCLGAPTAGLRRQSRMAPHPIPRVHMDWYLAENSGRPTPGQKKQRGKFLRLLDSGHRCPNSCQ